MPDDPYKRAAELLLSITEAQKKLGQLNVESPFESVTVGDAGWSLDERLRRAVMGTHYERPIKTLLKYTLPFITEKPASTRPGVELNITSDEVRELMGGSMPGLPTGLYGAMAEGAEGEFEQRFANLYKVNIYRQYAKKHGLKERDVIIPSIPQFHGLMWALDQTSRPWRAGVTGAWHALRWRQLVVDDAVKNGMDPSTELRRRRNDIAKVSWDAAVRGLRGKEFVNVAEVLEMMPPVVSDVLSMGTVQSSMSGGGVFQGRGMGMPLTPEQRQLQYQIAGTIGEFGDPSMWMPLSWLTKPGALAGRLTRLNKLAAGIKEMKSYKDTAYRTMELARTVGVERGTGIPAMDVVWNMRVDRFDYLKGTGVARADRIVKEVAKLPEELQPMPVLLAENKDLPDIFTWIREVHGAIQPEVDALVATGKA